MARQFLCGIDMAKSEIQNFRFQNLGIAPSSPLDGLVYFDSSDYKFYGYGNGKWINFGGSDGLTLTQELLDRLTNATNLNTPSAIVMRDASGNFSAGTITATLSGNASTATKLATPRSLELSGDGTGSANFDGSNNSTITLTLANSGVTAGTYTKVTVDAKGRVTGATTLSATDIPTLTLSKISDVGTAASKNIGTSAGNVPVLDAGGKLDTNVLPAIAITDTYPVASQVEMLALTAQRGDIAIRSDIPYNFILTTEDPTVLTNWKQLAVPTDAVTSVAGKIGAVILTSSDVGLGSVNNTADNAKAVLSATKLTTTRAIALSGDATGTINFDGTAGVTIPLVLATVGTAGTFRSVTVNAKGLVTAGTNPTTLAGYGITDATPSSHVGGGGAAHANATTTVAGFQSSADKTKLDGITTGANAYTHPTGDGNSHVPVTGTSNNGKVLKSGATANSASWGNVAYSELTGVPTNLTKKYSVAIGDGTATSIVVTHGLNTKDIITSLAENIAPYNIVITDIQITSENTITLMFSTAPSLNQYKLVVIG